MRLFAFSVLAHQDLDIHAYYATILNMTAQSSFQTTSWLTSGDTESAAPDVDGVAPLEGSDNSATEQSANGTNNSNRVAVAVACVQCRSRHLKCDGAARCARCVSEGIQCSYVKSRRGWKGPRKSVQRLISAPPNGPSIGMKHLLAMFQL